MVGWFDDGPDTAAWYEGSWYGPTVSPTGSSVLGLSYLNASSHWAYQSIGTRNAGQLSVAFQFDAGSFTDAGGARNMGLTFTLYQSDGSFVGADRTDIAGAFGTTLIDSFSMATGNLTPGQMLTGLTGSLNLASANTTGELFLRVSNYAAGTGDPWAAVDNLTIIPEPGAALLGTMAGLFLFRRSRR